MILSNSVKFALIDSDLPSIIAPLAIHIIRALQIRWTFPNKIAAGDFVTQSSVCGCRF
jgi:hypothetical protein